MLSYNNSSELSGRDSPFTQDFDYSQSIQFCTVESLNLIEKYYGNSGLDLSFLQLAIVSLNKDARIKISTT